MDTPGLAEIDEKYRKIGLLGRISKIASTIEILCLQEPNILIYIPIGPVIYSELSEASKSSHAFYVRKSERVFFRNWVKMGMECLSLLHTAFQTVPF